MRKKTQAIATLQRIAGIDDFKETGFGPMVCDAVRGATSPEDFDAVAKAIETLARPAVMAGDTAAPPSLGVHVRQAAVGTAGRSDAQAVEVLAPDGEVLGRLAAQSLKLDMGAGLGARLTIFMDVHGGADIHTPVSAEF